MTVVAYKDPSSDLRRLLKIFKLRFDDIPLLRRYEPALRRLLYLGHNHNDQTWKAEAFHQLALMYQATGQLDKARNHYQESLQAFNDYETLGMARTMRDYGLFIATYYSPAEGLGWVTRALELHDRDRNNEKGQRQRKLTESYVWRVRLIGDRNDTEARAALIRFATETSRDCSLRDQQQAILFVLPYVTGIQRQLLRARLVEINTRRHKLVDAVGSMAKLVIDTEILIAHKLVSSAVRFSKGVHTPRH